MKLKFNVIINDFLCRFTGLGNDSSNMAVMEVTLPSGYTADPDSIPNLRASPYVQRVETKDGDTVVVLYFDKVNK